MPTDPFKMLKIGPINENSDLIVIIQKGRSFFCSYWLCVVNRDYFDVRAVSELRATSQIWSQQTNNTSNQ